MFKKIKQLICKIFHIKACQCPDEPIVLKEETKIERVGHCRNHTRYRVNCGECNVAIR
jgi:hypothetical protein